MLSGRRRETALTVTGGEYRRLTEADAMVLAERLKTNTTLLELQ